MPYAYMMAWFVAHCEKLMPGGTDTNEKDLPTVFQFEERWWKFQYIVVATKVVDSFSAYRFFRFFPHMNDVDLEVS